MINYMTYTHIMISYYTQMGMYEDDLNKYGLRMIKGLRDGI